MIDRVLPEWRVFFPESATMYRFDLIQKAIPPMKESRYHMYTAVAFFLAGALIGFKQPEHFGKSFNYLAELAGYLKDRNAIVVMMVLFLKKAGASFIVIWTGTLLGIVSLYAAIQNGIVMGVVLSHQKSVLLSLLNTLPHGIFELPAFLMACGIGLWRGMWLFRKDKHETYKERALKGYLVFFRVILPLLIIAAIIEGGRIALLTQ
jgi:stage II sporulation protein M